MGKAAENTAKTVEKTAEKTATEKTQETVKTPRFQGLKNAGRTAVQGVRNTASRIGKIFSAVTKNLRAAVRMGTGLALTPALLGLAAFQGFVVRPLTGNQTAIPNLIYRIGSRLIGLKVKFNKASAPVVKDRPVWYVANHISNADFLALGVKLNGTFAGKGDIMKWPVVSQMAQAMKYIGLRRSSQYNAQSRAKLIKNFNQGQNAIMFPEGTTSDGSKMHLFRAALPGLLYGDEAVDKYGKEVTLDKDVLVQPVAIKIKSVNGKDPTGNAELREKYAMYHEENMLKRIWKRMQVREITVELTALPPLNPKDFKDAKELMNKSAQEIATIASPGQTVFKKAEIPGQAQKTAQPEPAPAAKIPPVTPVQPVAPVKKPANKPANDDAQKKRKTPAKKPKAGRG